MNVPWICNLWSSPVLWAGGLYISGVDFGCFSTKYGDCEALEKREEQTDFTLFVCLSPSGLSGISEIAQRSEILINYISENAGSQIIKWRQNLKFKYYDTHS